MEGERENDLHVHLDEVEQEETEQKEKRPWMRLAKSGLRVLQVGLRYGRRCPRYGLRYGRRWGWPALKWIAALSLPFFVLVRGSMYAYQSMGWGTWSSIGLGVFGTVVVFSGYATWLWRRLNGEGRWPQIVRPVLIAVVGGYSMYGLLYLSSANVKDPDIRDDYLSLHPLMRLASSTYFLFDRNAVVTDLERTAEDYLAMGIPINEASLHFKLEDRYVHAMDLRTLGRSPSRNALTVAYFRIMGFRSLHHVSSADHLHVSLPVR
jgi:hypothetical protein